MILCRTLNLSTLFFQRNRGWNQIALCGAVRRYCYGRPAGILGCPTGVLGDGTGEPLTGNVALAHLIIVLFWLDFVDPERRKEIKTAERVHLHLYSLLSTKRLV